MGELTKSRAHLVLSSGQSALNGNGKGSNLKIMKESDDEESDDQETDDEWDADENSADLNKLGKSKKGNDFLDQFFDQLPSKKTETDIRLERDISFDYFCQKCEDERGGH